MSDFLKSASDSKFVPAAQADVSGSRPVAGVEWKVSPGLVLYPEALAAMEERVAAIRAGAAPEQVWLLEHPPIYTAGTSAKPADLLDVGRLPVYRSGRGGQYTYHGPGQRVAYLMLDLAKRGGASGLNLRAFVRDLERWLIRTLGHFGVKGASREGRVGVWVELDDGREAKIAAIGLRIKQWVSLHGVSLNVDPDLEHYRGIVACGLREHEATSLAALGLKVGMAEVDAVLRRTFEEIFGS